MIDWMVSAKLNDCTVEWLKSRFMKFPKSNKKVVAICDVCGEEREVTFQSYSPLCHPCSHNTDEYCNNRSKISTVQWSNQSTRDDQTERLKQFNKDHPEAGKSHSNWMINYCKDPEVLKEYSERTIEQWSDQANRDRASEIRLNSEAAKVCYEIMRSGNDIVNHHYIYDHANPELYTMELTRSKHAKIHWWMRKAGIKVPHLNITEENKDIFKR